MLRALVIPALALLAFLPLPLIIGSQEAKCAYVVAVMAFMWLTEAVPITVTALLPVFMFPMAEVLKASDVAESYINNSSLLFLGGLMVAVAVEEANLHKRMALNVLRLVGTDPKWIMLGLMAPTWFLSMWISNTATVSMMQPMLGLMVPTWFLSMWISNTATVSMMMPIVEAVLSEISTAQDGLANEANENFTRMGKGLSLCIAYAGNIGGIATLTGTPPNLVLKGQADFDCCRKNVRQMAAVKKVILKELEDLGPVTFAEIMTSILFSLLVVLWVSRDPRLIPGWSALFQEKYVSDATAAMFVAVLFFIFPKERPHVFCCRVREPRYKPLLSWTTVEARLPWGVVVLLGGGFALAAACQESGLSSLVGSKLATFDSLDPWVLNLIICITVAMATEITSNTATATLLMPMMAELAVKLKVNPLYLMSSSALSTSFAFMMPVATPPNAIVFSHGRLTILDMVKAGALVNVFAVLILTLAVNTWGDAIFDFSHLPEIFLNETVSSDGLSKRNITT
ncbi:hypothetical protein EGW08_014919 [Elysia chlorotica]|uniref:Citrate transporter-like domain-containing protein n=1 Tax=Elysia chlorotica TaxID=188477 RepID=A0A3S1B832_ELYCH|nr:hypothetical protein EGW08_014919 [Elysia chlorotica]